MLQGQVVWRLAYVCMEHVCSVQMHRQTDEIAEQQSCAEAYTDEVCLNEGQLPQRWQQLI